MANDEVDAVGLGDADLEHPAGGVGADEDREVVEVEHSDAPLSSRDGDGPFSTS